MEEPPQEPLGLVDTKALCSLLAKGNHASTVPWGSWRCESTTDTNEGDIPWPLILRSRIPELKEQITSSPNMKLVTLIIATAIAANAFGQDVVNISIPKGGSWLLTGGGQGQDDAPAPFLPATAIIQNYSEDATVRIMNSGNSKQLRTYPLSAKATTRLIVNPRERLLIDSELARNQISVSYDLPLLPIIIRNESTSPVDVELSDGRRFNSPSNQDISLKAQPGTSVKINNVEVARVLDYCSGQGQVIKTKFP